MCHRVFDSDYRKKHNDIYHSNLKISTNTYIFSKRNLVCCVSTLSEIQES